MAGLSATLKASLLDAMLRNQSYQGPASLYIGLHTGDPGANGTANELSYTGYVRQSITFAEADASGSVNAADILFPETDEAVGTVTYYSIHSADTGAYLQHSGTLTGNAIETEKRPKIAAGALLVIFA